MKNKRKGDNIKRVGRSFLSGFGEKMCRKCSSLGRVPVDENNAAGDWMDCPACNGTGYTADEV